jgi:hypothetical protein
VRDRDIREQPDDDTENVKAIWLLTRAFDCLVNSDLDPIELANLTHYVGQLVFVAFANGAGYLVHDCSLTKLDTH